MHVLVVEDDPRLSEYLENVLTRENYTVDICASVDEVKAYMVSINEPPRLVILDRMLGRDDGVTLVPLLRNRYPEIGILILSSLDLASEKARIIDAGVDEYVAKPFSLEELTARLRLVARRSGGAPHAETFVRQFGNLSLDLKSQTATVGSHKLDLTRKEYQLLSLFMDTPGRVYNRLQILDRIWEISHLTESNVVEAAIKNLRRKLEEAGCTARIESKRNVGYWLEK